MGFDATVTVRNLAAFERNIAFAYPQTVFVALIRSKRGNAFEYAVSSRGLCAFKHYTIIECNVVKGIFAAFKFEVREFPCGFAVLVLISGFVYDCTIGDVHLGSVYKAARAGHSQTFAIKVKVDR